MYITDPIRKLLRDRFESSGKLKKEAAEETGVRAATFGRWLSGEIKRINPDRVPDLARYLGMSPDELLGMANPIAGRLLSSKMAPFDDVDPSDAHFLQWLDENPAIKEFLMRAAVGHGYQPPNTKKKQTRLGNTKRQNNLTRTAVPA